jgi:hypothetical protein
MNILALLQPIQNTVSNMHMVRQCQLHLISTLRSDAALFFLYARTFPKCSPRPRLGEQVDVQFSFLRRDHIY